MARNGVRLAMTPAVIRDHARQFIAKHDVMDRERVRRQFVEEMITSTEIRFSLAQMRAAIEGLEQGMWEGVK
jgi:signal transduction histidine kinase